MQGDRGKKAGDGAAPATGAGAGPSALELRQRLIDAGMIDLAGEGEDPGSTRSRVLKAAVKLFADRGFDACTMRDLGREVGVKAPAIYNYYGSKEEILAAASRDALTRFFTAVVGPLEEDSPEQRLELLVRRWVAFEIEEREVAQANDALIDTGALERLLPPAEWERIAAALRDLVRIVSALIGGADDAGHRVRVSAFISVCDRSWRSLRRERQLDPERVADQTWAVCARIVAAGLTPAADLR